MTAWQRIAARASSKRGSTVDASVYVGVALVIVGIALIAYGWGRVASLHDVSLQLPYIASTSFPGVALTVCGVAIALMGVRARDAAARSEQLDELASTLRAIREAIAVSEDEVKP